MKPNQFSPTPSEVEEIKLRNKTLPVSERVCYKCGHQVCPHCGTWCDSMLSDITWPGNWDGLEKDEIDQNGKVYPPFACCDGECSYL